MGVQGEDGVLPMEEGADSEDAAEMECEPLICKVSAEHESLGGATLPTSPPPLPLTDAIE